jgi:hypothetical protein
MVGLLGRDLHGARDEAWFGTAGGRVDLGRGDRDAHRCVVEAAVTIADLALLDDLYDELQRGKVYECSLRDPRWHLDGLQDGENIYIDPRPAILETLVHELLHRRKPRWGERAVTKQARRIVFGMDEPTKVRWWRAYAKVKRRGPAVDVED